MTFAVITPTIGTKDLAQCITSLRGQDCTHYIVVDGQEHNADVNKIVLSVGLTDQMKFIWLQNNIGKGWYGHRVFAAASFLVNEDVICYLDEDNWVEPDYIDAFKKVLNTHEHQWAYTLRNIMNPEGAYICQDLCESLGHWPVSFAPTRNHIDTGCFAVPRSIALKVGHHWYGQWGADRQFFSALKSAAPSFGCTTKHTLNYRLGSATSMASQEMFLRGNDISQGIYKGDYPWHKHPKNMQQGPQVTYHTTRQQNPFS